MPASPESVSSDGGAGQHDAPRLLLVSLSWLGDCIMALPALASFRKRAPRAFVSVLAKPAVAPLWRMVPGVDEVLQLDKGFAGTPKTVRRVRDGRYDFSYVLPRSFRAAVIPFLAGVPGRRGLAGHGRDWMLSEVIPYELTGHQSGEYARLLGVMGDPVAPPPYLAVPADEMAPARRRLTVAWQDRVGPLEAPRVAGFFPGAARGPSKRWPAERFVALGKRLLGERSCRILVLGTDSDAAVCAEVTQGIGRGALNLAGRTSLAALAATLTLCRVVVANDSGGMHLAAAVGTPVVGLFGLTDPARTAPLGTGHRLIAARGVARSRDIARDSEQARRALASLTVDEVWEAAAGFLA